MVGILKSENRTDKYYIYIFKNMKDYEHFYDKCYDMGINWSSNEGKRICLTPGLKNNNFDNWGVVIRGNRFRYSCLNEIPEENTPRIILYNTKENNKLW